MSVKGTVENYSLCVNANERLVRECCGHLQMLREKQEQQIELQSDFGKCRSCYYAFSGG